MPKTNLHRRWSAFCNLWISIHSFEILAANRRTEAAGYFATLASLGLRGLEVA